jgi:hypothetical protein
MKIIDVLSDVGRPMTYYPRLARAVGGVQSCVFVCQMIYWRDKGVDKEGWVWKSQQEIEEETGLSRWEQATIRRNLTLLGLLEENYDRLHHKMYFRVNLEGLEEGFHESLKEVRKKRIAANPQKRQKKAISPSECGNTTFGNVATPHSLANVVNPKSGTPHSGMREHHIRECGNITFDTIRAEITTEITKEPPLPPSAALRSCETPEDLFGSSKARPGSLDEVEAFMLSDATCRAKNLTSADAEDFLDRMAQNGWKTKVGSVKDWKAAVRNYVRNNWLASLQPGAQNSPRVVQHEHVYVKPALKPGATCR